VKPLTLIMTMTLTAIMSNSVFAMSMTNPEFRIRAKFRDASDNSVGNADVRVQSRFMKIYYGGVVRNDDFKFKVQLDSASFANSDFDVFLAIAGASTDFFVGTVTADTAGIVDTTYKTPFKAADAPDLPLPAGFPEPVSVGDVVKIFDHTTSTLVLSAPLEEDIARGDVNQDGKVDIDDFPFLEANFGLPGVGPSNGDFDGDNLSDINDYNVFVANWTDKPQDIPPVPALVPEPVGAAVLFSCGAWLLGVRPRRHPKLRSC